MGLEKTLESPLDSKETKPVSPKRNQPWIFIGSTDAKAEAPVFTLATWCKDLTHWKRPWCWEILRAGGEGSDRMRCLDGITDSMDTNLGKLWGMVSRQAWCATVHGVTKTWTQLGDWETTNGTISPMILSRFHFSKYEDHIQYKIKFLQKTLWNTDTDAHTHTNILV